FFLFHVARPLRAVLFPYTTLFRSDAGLLAQAQLQVLDSLALELLANLRRDLRERRRLGVTHVVEPDHVVAELGADRLAGGLALVERDHRVAELLHEGVRRVPVEVAAVLGGTRVLRLLGQVLEAFAGPELRDDLLRL